MPRKVKHTWSTRAGEHLRVMDVERVDYSKFATPEWELLLSFF